jgi:GNAT superfamily N-acetyltransferase
MIIQKISLEEVLPIRRQVMWPEESLEFVRVLGDENAQHWGGFYEGELVSVISIFEEGNSAQFRKFATITSKQGQGFGTKLLQETMNELRSRGICAIWCHARLEKVEFYQKFGLEISGSPFEKHGKKYVPMKWMI